MSAGRRAGHVGFGPRSLSGVSPGTFPSVSIAPAELAPLAIFAPGLPRADTVRDAASLVGMPQEDIAFFTGAHLRSGRVLAAHAHYRYRWVAKKAGGYRLIEAPKLRLRAMQRALLDRVLTPVPLHDAAHAFTRGRSVRTFAAPHAGASILVRLDLEDFFATVGVARVVAITTMRSALVCMPSRSAASRAPMR